MNNSLKLILCFIVITSGINTNAQQVITTDIDNFWKAYDKITQVKDSALQYQYLNEGYLFKGSPGLNAIREERAYSAEDYIHAIHTYPAFWNAVRQNTLKANATAKDLEAGIEKLRKIYPDLKPAKIYFTIGALRSNGTTQNDMVLIGSELAMADPTTVSAEFPENQRSARRRYFDSDPFKDIVLLNIHEYVHTQQRQPLNNLLSYVIREGVAEFVSVKAMGVPSAAPAIAFGKLHVQDVRARFEHEMFYNNNQNQWLWSDATNKFGVRDLGYYVGYQMCENYYEKAADKKAAIKKMIGLNFADEKEIESFVKRSGYFSKSLDELYRDFEMKRPVVTGIKQFANKSKNVNPALKEITIEFSAPLNGLNTGVDFGDLGQSGFPKNNVNGRFWAKDNKSWTISVDLEPNKKYQILISNNFRTADNIPLKAFLIEFETGN